MQLDLITSTNHINVVFLNSWLKVLLKPTEITKIGFKIQCVHNLKLVLKLFNQWFPRTSKCLSPLKGYIVIFIWIAYFKCINQEVIYNLQWTDTSVMNSVPKWLTWVLNHNKRYNLVKMVWPINYYCTITVILTSNDLYLYCSSCCPVIYLQ